MSASSGPIRPRHRIVTAAFTLLLLFAACGDGDGSSNNGGHGNSGPKNGTLEEACQQYCAAAAELGCPDDQPRAQCIDACIDLADVFEGCGDEWRDLNYCMADAPLFCERGTAAVKVADCPEVEDFDACVQRATGS